MFVISVVDGAAIIICASASRESDGTYRDFEEASKIGNQNRHYFKQDIEV